MTLGGGQFGPSTRKCNRLTVDRRLGGECPIRFRIGTTSFRPAFPLAPITLEIRQTR